MNQTNTEQGSPEPTNRQAQDTHRQIEEDLARQVNDLRQDLDAPKLRPDPESGKDSIFIRPSVFALNVLSDITSKRNAKVAEKNLRKHRAA